MKSKFDDHPLVQRIRWMSKPDKYPGLAVFVLVEEEIIHLLEDNARLSDENMRLKRIVNLIELKNERDALTARVAELEAKSEDS
jgi:hypothetical protein